MDFFKVLEKRHCCRKFNSDKKVSDEFIKKIIKAGKMAPSAGGIYPIEFAIVKDQKTKNALAEATRGGKSFIADAPIILVIWADISKTESQYGDRGKNLYVIQDGAAAAENIFLAITALGLSTCWIGSFDEKEKKVGKILGLGDNQEPQVIMPIGYPTESNKF